MPYLQNAKGNKTPFPLKGDVHAIYAQSRFLIQKGFTLIDYQDSPFLATEEDFLQALRLFWEHRPAEWYKYEEEYIRRRICSREEFEAAMRITMRYR